jgi:hypothetical protein
VWLGAQQSACTAGSLHSSTTAVSLAVWDSCTATRHGCLTQDSVVCALLLFRTHVLTHCAAAARVCVCRHDECSDQCQHPAGVHHEQQRVQVRACAIAQNSAGCSDRMCCAVVLPSIQQPAGACAMWPFGCTFVWVWSSDQTDAWPTSDFVAVWASWVPVCFIVDCICASHPLNSCCLLSASLLLSPQPVVPACWLLHPLRGHACLVGLVLLVSAVTSCNSIATHL